MIEWIFKNGPDLLALLEFLALVVLGAFAFFGVFAGKEKGRKSESDQLADGLIKRLQETVKQQTVDINTLQEQSRAQQAEIHQLQGTNDAYFKIITLRDPLVKKVFDDAPEVQNLIRDTHALMQNQAKAIAGLTTAMEDFINSLPPMTRTMTA